MALISYPKDIKALTSLRFFAAFWVVVMHFRAVLPAGAEYAILQKGDLAVDFFFVLSGFILAHANVASLLSGTFSYKDFLVKRLSRIYPMHFATLLFYAFVGVFIAVTGRVVDNPARYDFAWFFPYLFLVNAWVTVDHGTFNYPSWSVSAEWFAYILFPLFTSIFLSRKLPAFVGLFLAATLLLIMYVAAPTLLGYPFMELHSQFGIYRIFPEFALGISVYRIGLEGTAEQIGQKWFLAIVLLLATFTSILDLSDLSVIFLLALLILVYAELCRRGEPLILNNSFFVYLGEISYSVYMIHIPFATIWFKLLVPRFGGLDWSAVLVGAVLVVPIAALTHRLIEVPARNYLHRKFLNGKRRVEHLAA